MTRPLDPKTEAKFVAVLLVIGDLPKYPQRVTAATPQEEIYQARIKWYDRFEDIVGGYWGNYLEQFLHWMEARHATTKD